MPVMDVPVFQQTGSNCVAGTHAALHAPPVSLASCIFAYITRSTLEAPLLSAHQRMNHFAAMQYCAISWFVRGECERVWIGDEETDFSFNPVLFCGPITKPSASLHRAQVDIFTLVLMPGALHLMTGIDIAAYTDRILPFDQVFDVSWQDLARRVQEAPGHAQRIALIEEFIAPLWNASRTRSVLRWNWLLDHLHGLAIGAMASGWAGSARQLERRIKAWSGLPLRNLRRLQRAEQAFYQASAARQSGELSWAHVAADAGYADQAHLCRETRRVTGLSATELTEKIMHEESYWAYRLLRGMNNRDG